jgi:hypothetical protein
LLSESLRSSRRATMLAARDKALAAYLAALELARRQP